MAYKVKICNEKTGEVFEDRSFKNIMLVGEIDDESETAKVCTFGSYSILKLDAEIGMLVQHACNTRTDILLDQIFNNQEMLETLSALIDMPTFLVRANYELKNPVLRRIIDEEIDTFNKRRTKNAVEIALNEARLCKNVEKPENKSGGVYSLEFLEGGINNAEQYTAA